MFPIRERYRDKPPTFFREHKLEGRPVYTNLLLGLPFDYPDYAGLPKKIVNQLSSEAVDAMQFVLQKCFVRKRDFARAYKQKLIDFGEKLR
jgi:hypothetical protein